MYYTSKFRKNTGTHFSLLLAFSNLEKNPLIYLDEDEKIVACNEASLQLYDVDSLEKLHKKTSYLKDSFINEEPYFYSESDYWCKKVCSLGEQKVKINLPHTALKIFTLEMQRSRIDGYSYYIAILRDTTILDRAKQAQHYFETFKQKFLHSISHEFRTPMNSIIGYSDLLEHTALDPQQNEYLEMIEKSTSSMMQKVANLLQLMELESGLLLLKDMEYNPLKEFEKFAELFIESAQEKNIQFMLLIDPHLPKILNGDFQKIKTVLSSLINNALKFTQDGGNVYVEIKLRTSKDDEANLEFVVNDTGSGISDERVRTLLRPFASAWENRERGIDGLGIGLSLSHKLLSLMNSKLQLSSEINKGSRFSFRIKNTIVQEGSFEFVDGSSCAIWAEDLHTAIQAKLLRNYLDLFEVKSIEIGGLATPVLKDVDILFIITSHIMKRRIKTLRKSFPKLKIVPVIEASEYDKFEHYDEEYDAVMSLPLLPHRLHRTLAVLWDKMPKEYLQRRVKTHNEKDFHNVKILIAEDNVINLKLIETILAQENYHVVTAENGQIAVDTYLKEPFDLVLMDIDMPVMDGITANRLIKEINKHNQRAYTPVIALTARALSGDRERIMKAGLDAHLPKPIDKELLLETIEKFLALKQEV
ncbi:MAG: response regulator [Campylobacterota bacterium]|nr:response regulator [Campylobacterota bacterium]